MNEQQVFSMRLKQYDGNQVIYPVSLTYMQDDILGQESYFGGKTVAEHEIYICVEGEAVSYVGDATYSIKGGTVLTYHPTEQHHTFVTSPRCYRRYVLLFHYDRFNSMWLGADSALFAMVNRPAYERNAIQLLPKEMQKLQILLERAVAYDSENPSHQALFLSDFIRMMQILSMGFQNTKERVAGTTRVPMVNMALELIDKHYCQIQRVDEIAKKLNVSDSYLARMFKKQVGTSVYDYILNMKFAHAVRLLAAGSSVTDACFESGFNSYSHFIQMFKRRYGFTPKKYQKNMDV